MATFQATTQELKDVAPQATQKKGGRQPDYKNRTTAVWYNEASTYTKDGEEKTNPEHVSVNLGHGRPYVRMNRTSSDFRANYQGEGIAPEFKKGTWEARPYVASNGNQAMLITGPGGQVFHAFEQTEEAKASTAAAPAAAPAAEAGLDVTGALAALGGEGTIKTVADHLEASLDDVEAALVEACTGETPAVSEPTMGKFVLNSE